MRSDSLHKSDLIRSHFTLFAPSKTQSTELSSWRGNWNHVRTAQLRVAGLRSCVGKMRHLPTNIGHIGRALLLDGTAGFGAFARILDSEIDVWPCKTSFKSY